MSLQRITSVARYPVEGEKSFKGWGHGPENVIGILSVPQLL